MKRLLCLASALLLCISLSGCIPARQTRTIDLPPSSPIAGEENTPPLHAGPLKPYSYTLKLSAAQGASGFRTAFWDAQSDGHIIINQFDQSTGLCSFERVEYRYGFYETFANMSFSGDAQPVFSAPNGLYAIRELLEGEDRNFYLEDLANKRHHLFLSVPNSLFPAGEITFECAWSSDAQKVLYGFCQQVQAPASVTPHASDAPRVYETVTTETAQDAFFTIQMLNTTSLTVTPIADRRALFTAEDWQLHDYRLSFDENGRYALFLLPNEVAFGKGFMRLCVLDTLHGTTVFIPTLDEENLSTYVQQHNKVYAQTTSGDLYAFNYLAQGDAASWGKPLLTGIAPLLSFRVLESGDGIIAAQYDFSLNEMGTNNTIGTQNMAITLFNIAQHSQKLLYRGNGDAIVLALSPDGRRVLVESKRAMPSQAQKEDYITYDVQAIVLPIE